MDLEESIELGVKSFFWIMNFHWLVLGESLDFFQSLFSPCKIKIILLSTLTRSLGLLRAMAVLLGDFMRTVLFFDGGTTIKQGNEAIAIDIKPPQNSVACKVSIFHSCICHWWKSTWSRLGLFGLISNYMLKPGLFHISIILLGPTAIWNLLFSRRKADT